MKVAHLINSMGTGGAENLIAESVSVFKNKGVVVDVILLNGTATPFLNKLQANGCTPVILGLQSVYNPLLIFKIIPLLKKYDIVHVHLFPALYYSAIAKFFSFSKVKLLFTEHNTVNKRLSNSFFVRFDQFIYQFYTKIICISAEIEIILHAKIPITKNKTVVILNGINLKKETSKILLQPQDLFKNATANTKFITQVAGFRVQKDQPTAIKAMQLLPQNRVLLLVGEGTEREACQKLAVQLGVADRVVFLGIRSDVSAILHLSHFVVLASHHEGLSLASIEGLASGKPFIASDVPGLHEVVAGAGLLFEDGDYKALAQHILQLDTNFNFYNQTVKNCLKRAAEFDIEIMVQKQIELYKTLII